MDDLLLFTPSKNSHIAKLEDFLKTLLKNGWKISSKKSQLFREILQYMGNDIFIKHKRVSVKALQSRLEALQKTAAPHYSKRMQKLCGNGKFPGHILP